MRKKKGARTKVVRLKLRSISDNEHLRELVRSYADLLSEILKIKVYKIVKGEENETIEEETNVDNLVMEALMLPLPIKSAKIDKDNKRIIIEVGEDEESG